MQVKSVGKDMSFDKTKKRGVVSLKAGEDARGTRTTSDGYMPKGNSKGPLKQKLAKGLM